MSNHYFKRPTLYMSHPVRGTSDDCIGNCRIAAKAANKLCKLFPEIDIYCPGQHDLVVQTLWNENKLSIENIMYADLKILQDCDGWFYYHFDESKGCERERDEAIMCSLLPSGCYLNDIFYNLSKANYNKIRKTFIPIVEQAVEHFRRKT